MNFEGRIELWMRKQFVIQKDNVKLGLVLFFLVLGWCLKIPTKFWILDPATESTAIVMCLALGTVFAILP